MGLKGLERIVGHIWYGNGIYTGIMEDDPACRVGYVGMEGFHGSKSGCITGGVRARKCTRWRLGSLANSLANGVVKGRPSAFPIPNSGKFSDGFSKS